MGTTAASLASSDLTASTHEQPWDVIIVGGGPSGATAASLIARGGRRVLVLEKEQFPRYQIGESLIPGCLRVLDAIGAREEVEQAGFVVKRGVTFWWGAGNDWAMNFDEQRAVPNYSFHVDRARFDDILLNHARRSGAEVRHGVTVRDIRLDQGDPVIVTDSGVLRARYVIDASGQTSLLGRKLGEREFDPTLRNVAVWRYYRGCGRLPEPRSGDLAVIRHSEGWWWYIPLEPGVGGLTSIGVIIRADSYRRHGGDPDKIFELAMANTPQLHPWMEGAEQTSITRVTSDWSYRSRRVAGDRWLLAGDAAGFIDPLLSTGCYLSLTAGYLAGLCLRSVLEDETLRPAAFRYYDASYGRIVDEIHQMVRVFYKAQRPEDAFDQAQLILGTEGDPREIFIRLAAGLTEHSGDTAMPSEVFGQHRGTPEHYGVPFATDCDRVLTAVDPADLPNGLETPMMLVERDIRLRFVPAAEVATWASSNGGHGPARRMMPLIEVRSDNDADRLLRERIPEATGRPALLVFSNDSEENPVAVVVCDAVEGERYWATIGGLALWYLTEPGDVPFDRPTSRGLLEEIRREAAALAADGTSPQQLSAAIAGRIGAADWKLVATASRSA